MEANQTLTRVSTNQTEAMSMPAILFRRMNAADIRYCHWKSTHELEKALRGGTDLDLLIDRADAPRFRRVLDDCHFKLFISSPHRQYPAVEDYLGFDTQNGALVHLHVHYRMILGDRYTKNYVIPLEKAFLNNTRMRLGVRLPAPELEIIVLVLRTLLKYRDRDAIRDWLKSPVRDGLSPSMVRELDYLLAQTNVEQVAMALERHADFIPPDLVMEFLDTVRDDPRDVRTLLRLRSRVRRALVPFQRASPWRARLEYFKTTLIQDVPFKKLRQYLMADRHKKSAVGGLGIAFIGTDGAGKSTVVQQIAKWLSWRVNVYIHYMGTTHPSPGTRVMRMFAGGGHVLHAASGRTLGQQNAITRAARWVDELLNDFRLIAEGLDRYNRFLAGQSQVAQGSVVIYDRFPLNAVRIDGRAMDGPRIAANGVRESSIFAKLARMEEDIYSTIRPPEHIVVLRVSPAVSQERKPEHRPERIQAKADALDMFARDGLNVTEINAEQPLEQVLLQIKSNIWDWI